MHYISATNFNDLNARFSDDSDDDCIIVQVDEAADVPKGKFVNFYATALLSSADMPTLHPMAYEKPLPKYGEEH